MVYQTKFGPVEVTNYAELALLSMDRHGGDQLRSWITVFKGELEDRARSSRGLGEREYHWLGAEAESV